MVKTDNHYLKTILGKVTGKPVKGIKNNNQLLKEISEKIGKSGGGDGTPIDLSDYYDKDETDELLSAKVDMIMPHHDTNSDKVTDAINELMGRKAETSELLSLMKSSDYDTNTLKVTYADDSTESIKFVIKKR